MEIGLKPSALMKTGIAVFSAVLVSSLPLKADDMQTDGIKAPADKPSAHPNEFYGGFAFGRTKIHSDVTIIKGNKFDDSDSGHMFFLGRELGNGWAVEAFYADLGKAEWSGKPGDRYKYKGTEYEVLAGMKGTSTGSTVGIAGKYSWDVHRKTRLYAKLGMHSWKIKTNMTSAVFTGSSKHDGSDVMGGIGVEYAISEKTRVIAGSDNFITDDDDVSLAYVGLRYGFN